MNHFETSRRALWLEPIESALALSLSAMSGSKPNGSGPKGLWVEGLSSKAHGKPANSFTYVRPALPVPRPGRDREAPTLWNIIWPLRYFVAEIPMLMPCKPGLGQGHGKKRDTHTLIFADTLSIDTLAMFSYSDLIRRRVTL